MFRVTARCMLISKLDVTSLLVNLQPLRFTATSNLLTTNKSHVHKRIIKMR